MPWNSLTWITKTIPDLTWLLFNNYSCFNTFVYKWNMLELCLCLHLHQMYRQDSCRFEMNYFYWGGHLFWQAMAIHIKAKFSLRALQRLSCSQDCTLLNSDHRWWCWNPLLELLSNIRGKPSTVQVATETTFSFNSNIFSSFFLSCSYFENLRCSFFLCCLFFGLIHLSAMYCSAI